MSLIKPLNTAQLNKILESSSVTGKHFLGTYPACFHPESKKNCYAFISNIDEHDEAGQHWCAWIVKKDNEKDDKILSFFDSFGRMPWDKSLPHHFKEICDGFERVQYTNTRIQNWTSKTCGYFCVHFIYTLCLGLNYEDFLYEYSKNYVNNDIVVVDFFKSIK
jgi:hypothetical protein